MKIENVSNESNDPYRSIHKLRLLGYIGNVADVIQPIIGRQGAQLGYLTSLVYFLADGYDKAIKPFNQGSIGTNALINAGDVFLWHLVASVAIPRFTRNRVTLLTRDILSKTKMNGDVKNTISMAMGLLSLSIIINPVDRFMDYLMDNTYRKMFD